MTFPSCCNGQAICLSFHQSLPSAQRPCFRHSKSSSWNRQRPPHPPFKASIFPWASRFCPAFPWWQPTPVFLPGKSHGRRSPVGCSPWGREESDMTEWLHFHFSFSCIGEGNGNPLQCSCLENTRDGGAWWAAVYGVTQSRTRLKWLSSSSMHLVQFLESGKLCQKVFVYLHIKELVVLYVVYMFPLLLWPLGISDPNRRNYIRVWV